MNTLDDWPRVKRVLEGALAREGAVRQAYLAEACGTDTALRERIDRLLAAADRVGAFLETPAAVILEPPVREDLSGRVVGSYQLVSRLGAGGMGEVYLAHDTKLDRPVALKFLSPELAADRNRLRRFDQEARAASSLNHPHIVVVHDSGELDGRPYIVTEFIEGETLRHRLQRGPLPMQDVVELGVQIAGALAAAHARGLVHRDIKPDNIMVRPDGYVKVLDFGLAKLSTPAFGQVDEEQRTQTGMVIGTPRYMSPEQARGLDLDARSDVWSLGVVLYEMATGRFPFAADGAVMAFDGGAATQDLHPELFRIIGKSLQPVRDLRYQSGAELCADLKHVQGDAVAQARAGRRLASFAPRSLALAAIVAAVGVLVSWPFMRNGVTVPSGVQKAVAVLPFDNVNGDAGIDYLRLALADEVATALSWTPSLAVRPMAASRKFAGGGVGPEQAGRELRVAGVVTGHFSMHQSELRVTMEAVEVDGNRLLWRDTIAAPVDDSIALRDRLTSRIRDGLLPALGTAAPTAPQARPRNAEAYALYLKSLANSTDPTPNREAIGDAPEGELDRSGLRGCVGVARITLLPRRTLWRRRDSGAAAFGGGGPSRVDAGPESRPGDRPVVPSASRGGAPAGRVRQRHEAGGAAARERRSSFCFELRPSVWRDARRIGARMRAGGLAGPDQCVVPQLRRAVDAGRPVRSCA